MQRHKKESVYLATHTHTHTNTIVGIEKHNKKCIHKEKKSHQYLDNFTIKI